MRIFKDFSNIYYKHLLSFFQEHNYQVTNMSAWEEESLPAKVVLLKHDVDRDPKNALRMAHIENELGIKASYYFRIVNESYNETIIEEIVKLGHEIGYHYEDLALNKGDFEKAKLSFERNLGVFRKFYPVKIICMHGSPASRWDNRLIWKKYNYRDFGIIQDAFFDFDFDQFFYITDASRRWNDDKVVVRDRVATKFKLQINNIDDLFTNIKKETVPDKVILNIHPHNWAHNNFNWLRIYSWQMIKNIIKRMLVIKRSFNRTQKEFY